MTSAKKEGKMPVDEAMAPPMAKLFAKNYGYKVCMNKKERFGSEQRKKATENPLYQKLLDLDAEEERK